MQEKFEYKNKILENEAELVEKAKTDEHAFELLYNFYFPKVYGYIFKRVGNQEAAEDIVSITFMKVFTNINSYTYRGFTFGAWIFRIATNNLVDYYRKEGKRKEVDIEQVYSLKDSAKTPDQVAQITAEFHLVKKALGKMKGRYHEILHLKFFAEMSTDEISKVMNISENNVRVLLHRALKKFNIIYDKYR